MVCRKVFQNSFRYTIWVPWAHRQLCNLGLVGVLGLSTIRPPLLGDPAGVDQAPACVQVALPYLPCYSSLDPQPPGRPDGPLIAGPCEA